MHQRQEASYIYNSVSSRLMFGAALDIHRSYIESDIHIHIHLHLLVP